MMELLKKLAEELKKQMNDSKEESYKILDDIPSIVKAMGQHWIDEATNRLESENKKVENKMSSLMDFIKGISKIE